MCDCLLSVLSEFFRLSREEGGERERERDKEREREREGERERERHRT